MRLPLLPALIIIIVGALVDWYIIFRAKKGDFSDKRIPYARPIYIIVSAVVSIAMLVVAVAPKKTVSEGQLYALMWTIFAYFSIYVPKYIIAVFSLLRQLFSWIFHRRLRIIALFGASFGAVLFILLWWGALVTRNSIDVRRVDVPVADLPAAFNGYRIVQISDIHTGTFGSNPRFLEKMVSRINELHPDIILFTGDIVNRHSSELAPFMPVLSGLKAPDGVWSVMGNHDYGEYYSWPSVKDRLDDVIALKSMQHEMGWTMLNNSHSVIRHGADSIVLIGVENIGDPPFTTYGNLGVAYPRLSDRSKKILLSHNPAHWVDSIANKKDVNIDLTLAGHTHAMQIRLFGKSPAALRYKTWGGLYADSIGRSLYVNTGIGEVGFPSRIGATPEITLITLTEKAKR